jgi:hypothetical protein
VGCYDHARLKSSDKIGAMNVFFDATKIVFVGLSGALVGGTAVYADVPSTTESDITGGNAQHNATHFTV